METLKLLTALMNHLALIGAREEMRRWNMMENVGILSYIEDDPAKTQLFLEYVYVGNRVGGALSMGTLDKGTILKTWTLKWWLDLWKKLYPLIEQERKRRGDNKLYSNFEWFVKMLKKR